MGIKGIYAELGPGQRVSLAKLASETLEKSGRPLRIAVDISIWQFQVQAAQGGTNPAIRTLFYRLARLLGHSIEPIFVFDGPRKPVFKRNKRSTQGDRTSTALARRLVKLFGFQTHDAPGEAEAECALLQQHGIVDAVLSEDVDTIMFGCSKTLRNWSAEVSNVKGSKAKSNTPTHITMYSVDDEHFIKSGLDREGMVLVALMSGGDYLPEGIPGCGPKVACEAARAGFGKSLCRLKRSDEAGLRRWRDSLIKELRTNESGFFRTKHKALAIPDDFPNLEVLRYYTHPVVSEAATVERLKTSATWSKPVDVVPLRGFTDEIFDWTNRIGAEKLVRVLAPGLLVQKLMHRSRAIAAHAPPLAVAEQEEAALVAKISGRRTHVSTDGMQELRAHFVPADIVGLDLEAEPEDAVAYARDGLALNSDDEFAEGEAAAAAAAAPKKTFDPTKLDAVWISESILKLGSPLTVEDFEAAERKKMAKKKAPTKVASSRAAKAGKESPKKTLDNWLKVTKAVNSDLGSSKPAPASSSSVLEPPPTQGSELPKPVRPRGRPKVVKTTTAQRKPQTAEPTLPGPKSKPFTTTTATTTTSTAAAATATRSRNLPSLPSSSSSSTSSTYSYPSQTNANRPINPWTLSSSQTSGPRTKASKNPVPAPSSALDTFILSSPPAHASAQEPILISSSPARPQTPPPPLPGKITRPTAAATTQGLRTPSTGGSRADTTPARAPPSPSQVASPNVDTPPRLRLPSEPLDTPPWLKSTGSRNGKYGSPDARPRQTTLDLFLSSPTSAPSRSGVTAEGSPTRRKGSSAKVLKAGGAAQQKIVFPVSKSASDRLGKKTGPAHREPLLELIGGEGSAAQRKRESAISIIDLTGDD